MTSITKFYSGRAVLVTGGTGFMGKVLLEKMLRSLPDIQTIYVLLREKRGINPEGRIRALTSALPFTFNNINPEHFKKLIAMHGDITKENLGLSVEDRQKLIEEVSVVFHLAASIRMDLNLKDAIILNTLSTQKVLDLCTEMKKLQAVVHLSTAYCNVDVEYMEEKVYKIRLDPYKIIDTVNWMDDECLEVLQENVIKPHPNTYTFSKRLAEIVALDMGKKLPVSIGRPSIVVPSYIEPVPGWVDNFNGPTGIMGAAGKGVLRSILVDRDTYPQVVPVDLAINALLIMACIRATQKYLLEHVEPHANPNTIYSFTETPIYNLTQGDIVKMSWDEVVEKCRKMAMDNPFRQMFWYPGGSGTKSLFVHRVKVLFLHMLPAYVIDFLLILFLQKPFLVNIQNRLNVGLKVVAYFALKAFTFTNENTMKIIEFLEPSERDIFPVTNIAIDADGYLKNAYLGAKHYCFKEIIDYDWFSWIQIRVLYVLDNILKLSLLYGLIWLMLRPLGLTYVMTLRYWFEA